MTHPHQHHATRAAQNLTTARHQLDAAVTREAAERRAEARITAAASAIQAWRPIPGPTGKGSHGDPASRAAVGTLEPDVRDGRLARLATSTTDTLTWLTRRLHLHAADDPLTTLTHAIPDLQPATAAHLWRWLDEADTRIRDTLQLKPNRELLVGLACPRCSARQLWLHTDGPTYTRTVTCEAGADGCLCIGDDCTCHMDIRAAGVRHIWPASAWPTTPRR
ncbi:hypothetical protein [Micromonospora sp. WMMD998]|uniref:hypothetical protein n=1 Tax=Micromonospora sp. WMMD998 TaxID=3016092 RepID=UPI00249CCAE0|nr:hypothetical protein [Micromonospora sp. WMMD998]WFE41939.1 hypothetical protein O7619_27225 [Micromonospora sp. WMMD998]